MSQFAEGDKNIAHFTYLSGPHHGAACYRRSSFVNQPTQAVLTLDAMAINHDKSALAFPVNKALRSPICDLCLCCNLSSSTAMFFWSWIHSPCFPGEALKDADDEGNRRHGADRKLRTHLVQKPTHIGCPKCVCVVLQHERIIFARATNK